MQWSSSRQSPLALVGSSLGYAGLLFTIFRLAKRYLHHHAPQVRKEWSGGGLPEPEVQRWHAPLQHASAAAAAAIAAVPSFRRLVINGDERASDDKDAGSPDKDTPAGGADENVTPMPPAGASEPPAPPSRLAWAAPPAARAAVVAELPAEGDTESQGLPTAATPVHSSRLRLADSGGHSCRSSTNVVLSPHTTRMPEDSSSAAAAGVTLVDVAVDVIAPDTSSVETARGDLSAEACQ